MAYERDEKELGALWEQEGKHGTYMTGTINGEAVVLWRNTRKAPGSKQPDWRVMKSQPKEERAPQDQARRAAGRPVFDDPDDPAF